jgi:hypothetical protein
MKEEVHGQEDDYEKVDRIDQYRHIVNTDGDGVIVYDSKKAGSENWWSTDQGRLSI